MKVVAGPGWTVRADDHIGERGAPGDLALTGDVPLAARPVDKGVHTIDSRRAEYTPDSMGERRSVRDFMDQLRSIGSRRAGRGA